MSRDLTSAEWIDMVLLPRRRDLEKRQMYLQNIRETAYAEGHAQALKEAVEEIEAMPAKGNSAQKLAARRVQNTLDIRYTEALRLVTDKKTDEINWGQAADAVLTEAAGDGFSEDAE